MLVVAIFVEGDGIKMLDKVYFNDLDEHNLSE